MQLPTKAEYNEIRHAVVAVMAWPSADEENDRKNYMAVSQANDWLCQGDTETSLPPEHISALLDAPSWAQIGSELALRTKQATVAGYVFSFMYLMDSYAHLLPPRGEPGGSLNKAFAITLNWAKDGATFRDGTAQYANPTSIRKYWEKFRPVAHLWAAYEFNKTEELRFAEGKEVFSERGVARLLQRAAHLQQYGLRRCLTNKSKAASPTLLCAESTWMIDLERHEPECALPASEEAVLDAPWMRFLRNYSAE